MNYLVVTCIFSCQLGCCHSSRFTFISSCPIRQHRSYEWKCLVVNWKRWNDSAAAGNEIQQVDIWVVAWHMAASQDNYWNTSLFSHLISPRCCYLKAVWSKFLSLKHHKANGKQQFHHADSSTFRLFFFLFLSDIVKLLLLSVRLCSNNQACIGLQTANWAKVLWSKTKQGSEQSGSEQNCSRSGIKKSKNSVRK